MGSFNMKANIVCVLIFISAVQGKGVCSAAAGDLCLDTLYGISATCCPPYSCTSVTSRTSVCKGSSLPAGETCFDSVVGSLGSCAESLLCLQNVCTEPASSCITPVNGLCYSSDIGKLLGTCSLVACVYQQQAHGIISASPSFRLEGTVIKQSTAGSARLEASVSTVFVRLGTRLLPLPLLLLLLLPIALPQETSVLVQVMVRKEPAVVGSEDVMFLMTQMVFYVLRGPHRADSYPSLSQ